MLLAYSQGLHHVHVPDHSRFPRLFRTVRMRIEAVDLAEYRAAMAARGGEGKKLVPTVVEDLTARRDRYCTSDVGARDEVAPVAEVPPAVPGDAAA